MHKRSGKRPVRDFLPRPALRLALAAALAGGLAACSGAAVQRPMAPDLAMLAPAEQEIEKARSVHADELAPASLRNAQRGLSQARNILMQAALRGTAPDADEKLAAQRLVEQSRVDALLAQAQTQRAAVGNALGEYERALRDDAADAASPANGSGPLNK